MIRLRMKRFIRSIAAIGVVLLPLVSIAIHPSAARGRSVLPLTPPNYADGAEVRRHVAFSIFFAAMIEKAHNAGVPKNCQLSILGVFLNLIFVPEATSLPGKCEHRLAEVLTSAEIDRPAFDAAVTDATQRMQTLMP